MLRRFLNLISGVKEWKNVKVTKRSNGEYKITLREGRNYDLCSFLGEGTIWYRINGTIFKRCSTSTENRLSEIQKTHEYFRTEEVELAELPYYSFFYVNYQNGNDSIFLHIGELIDDKQFRCIRYEMDTSGEFHPCGKIAFSENQMVEQTFVTIREL